jgi:hypothetical protein
MKLLGDLSAAIGLRRRGLLRPGSGPAPGETPENHANALRLHRELRLPLAHHPPGDMPMNANPRASAREPRTVCENDFPPTGGTLHGKTSLRDYITRLVANAT